MDAKLTDEFTETLQILMVALNLQGDFQSTALNLIVRRYLDSGCRVQLIEPLVKRLPMTALRAAGKITEEARAEGISILTPLSPDYPQELLQIADPPLALFVRGALERRFSVGVVGARRCTEYGKQASYKLGRVVSGGGGCVVSGLAFGIDAAAHRGALEGRVPGSLCPTLGVLGSGVLEIYPKEHQRLAEEILAAGGGLISEYGLRCLPRKYFFPRRNRIISGLSSKVVIVEAAKRSGSLITARLALEQGRDLAVVPGEIDSELSCGTNDLIAAGAQAIVRISDVLDGLPALSAQDAAVAATGSDLAELGLSQAQQAIAKKLVDTIELERVVSFEALQGVTALSTQELRSILLELELVGAIRPLGNSFTLAEKIDS